MRMLPDSKATWGSHTDRRRVAGAMTGVARRAVDAAARYRPRAAPRWPPPLRPPAPGRSAAAAEGGRGGSAASVSMVALRPPMTMRSVTTLPSMISCGEVDAREPDAVGLSWTQGRRYAGAGTTRRALSVGSTRSPMRVKLPSSRSAAMCWKLTVSSPDPMASSSAASAICLLKSGRRSDAGSCGSITTSSKLGGELLQGHALGGQVGSLAGQVETDVGERPPARC